MKRLYTIALATAILAQSRFEPECSNVFHYAENELEFGSSNYLVATCPNIAGTTSTTVIRLGDCLGYFAPSIKPAPNGAYGNSCDACSIENTGSSAMMYCNCHGNSAAQIDLNTLVDYDGYGVLTCNGGAGVPIYKK